jgi:hypothetical protein
MLQASARFYLFLTFCCTAMLAQGNYEIQVYGSDTVPPGNTMVELHSNFTFEGSTLAPSSSPSLTKTLTDGTFPTNHQLHETVEITQGWTSWFETGFYIFTSAGPGQGYQWVGDHIRPRVRVPDSWRWPAGAGVSTEIGYQRAGAGFGSLRPTPPMSRNFFGIEHASSCRYGGIPEQQASKTRANRER